MPRYYCDYCDTYLTHDSPSVRKQHNAGYKHKANVRTYYQQFEEQQTQSFIDQKVKEHQHMAASYHYKPMVGLPRPGMGLPGSSPAPMLRPPVMGGPPAGYNPPGGYRPPVAPLPGNSQPNGVYRPGPPGAGGPPPGAPRPASSNGVPPGGYPQSGYPGYSYGGPGPNYGSNQPPLPPPPPRPGTSSGYAYSQPPAAGSGDSPAGYRS